MEDGEIIELYWRRDEAAIVHSEEKYGAYCSAIICRILRLPEDVEECLGDTWMAAWNAIPPRRPAVLRTFLGRLSRNLSINRALHYKARKRGGGEVTAALEEEPELAYIYMANASVPACVEAIRACGREGRVRVLTHDNSPENRALLRAGTVDFVIGQNLAYQSYKALAVLFDAAAEHRVPERDCFYPETPIFNAENC